MNINMNRRVYQLLIWHKNENHGIGLAEGPHCYGGRIQLLAMAFRTICMSVDMIKNLVYRKLTRLVIGSFYLRSTSNL